jgi:hypothetical protein
VVWTYTPNLPPDQEWRQLIAQNSSQYGNPLLRQERRDGRVRDIAEWDDGSTVLMVIRDPLPTGPVYFGTLQDVSSDGSDASDASDTSDAANEPAAAPAAAAAPQGISSAPAPSAPPLPRSCYDDVSCVRLADHAAQDEKCNDALTLYGQALTFKPNPWAYFGRAVLERALADENLAQDDFHQALMNRDKSPDFNRMRLPTPDEQYGSDWSCRCTLSPKRPAPPWWAISTNCAPT